MNQTTFTPIGKPYRRTIGRTTFEVSSFGNPNATKTAQDLILQLLEGQVQNQHNTESEEHVYEGME